MTGAMTAFGLAVGGVSVAGYLLMTRAEKRRARRTSRDGSGADGTSYAVSVDGSIFDRSGGDHSATDSSGNRFSGGGDIASSGDSGGGGDGGGGGGGDGAGGGSD